MVEVEGSSQYLVVRGSALCVLLQTLDGGP